MTRKNSGLPKILFAVLILLNLTLACAQQQTQGTEPAQNSGISNQQISEYVRKALNVPADVAIEVKDSPSGPSGLRAVQLHFTSPRGNQTQEAWITKDNQLIMGRMFDLTVDPYKKNWEKISLNNVPSTGAAEAKVTIVEYSDFQCPFCSQANQTMEELMKQYEGKPVRLIYKHLPLNIHPWAEDAAVAAACVYQQNNDAFWKLSHFLFTNQSTIAKETVNQKILDFAKESNMNVDELKKCMDSRLTLPLVQANETEAGSLGFSSTPSFVINGRTVVGAFPLEQYKQIVDEALAAAK